MLNGAAPARGPGLMLDGTARVAAPPPAGVGNAEFPGGSARRLTGGLARRPGVGMRGVVPVHQLAVAAPPLAGVGNALDEDAVPLRALPDGAELHDDSDIEMEAGG